MPTNKAQLGVGQLVDHVLFNYRGVVYDADPVFMGSESWYEANALSRPPKDRPWYHVLVHDAGHTTYVAERNLRPNKAGEAVRHPEIDIWYEGFQEGAYIPHRTAN